MTEVLTGFAAKIARERAAAAGLPLLPGEGSFAPEDRAAEIAALNARLAFLGGTSQDRAVPAPQAPPVPAARVAAFSLSEAGVPAQTGVPDDFGAAQEAAVVNSGQLTAEEIAEFRALRMEKKERDRLAAEEAAAAAARLQAPTHHVHLADGTILTGSQIATHYALEDGRVIPVSGAYELAPVLT